MHRWEQEKKMKQEHQEFLQQGMQIPQEKHRKEYQYCTDFVKHNTEETNLDNSVTLLDKLDSAFRLMEKIMSEPHDIDAKNLADADLLFSHLNFAEKSDFAIENIQKYIESKGLSGKVANLAKAIQERSKEFISINNSVANLSNAMKEHDNIPHNACQYGMARHT
jgi:hypothetical protein